MLRELADVIARPLSIIFDRSWRLGEVPEEWRKVNVTPILKKGKKEDPGNYRPVRHIKDKKITRTGQHGFTKGKSCLTNLINFYEDMTVLVDKRRAVDIVYLDFRKAFDTDKILIYKLCVALHATLFFFSGDTI